ncbi:hypothetical protein NQ094_09030 [Enterobacter kobei]|uniref:hypothetical protein n=1 Tax=Enterobacter kobei TaxID=208224 RepID=UPI00214A3E32|nr:hypothetical protein [Enterobacter kobei]MCR2796163.1 hypothetical protein [Enterobacter kobei]
MSTFTKEQLIEKLQHRISVASRFPESEKAQMDLELARIALASLEAEPVGEVVLGEFDDCGCHPDARVACIAADGQADWENFKDGTRLYTAPPAPVSVPDVHHSVIAEQLNHVLSSLDATDHQRAVISCAVDRLNKVSQLLQASPSALLVPEMLDYQGAKELYNYLMNEEETNATVNGWNACRAAMQSATTTQEVR